MDAHFVLECFKGRNLNCYSPIGYGDERNSKCLYRYSASRFINFIYAESFSYSSLMKKQILGVFLILFAGNTVHVQAQGNVEINRPMSDDELKSVSEARNIALTNTLMPLATGLGTVALFENNTIQTVGAVMAVYGIIMGPSTGNFYAQDYGRGAAGLAARSVGAYLMVNATSEIFGRTFANSLNVDNKSVSLTDTKMIIGEVLILGGTVYNLLSAKTSVEQYNSGTQRFALRVTPSIVGDQVTPMLTARINL